MQLDVFLPPPLTGRGPSYTCAKLAQGMAGPGLQVTIITPRTRGLAVAPANVVQILPPWARCVPYRWVRSLAAGKIEADFLAHVVGAGGAARGAYIWPDASARAIAALRRANITVFREMINCPRGTAKVILDGAYRRLGVEPCHKITDASIAEEDAALDLVDYVFCPNPMVETSLQQRGLGTEKIMSASYGWDPGRFAGSQTMLPPVSGITAVFVGSISVRKGVHLLLDYWSRSGVQGRLVLAGTMEPTIRDKCARLLARRDVVVLDYVKDVGALYRSADVFVFPSLEEGGPQVTYEACGCALPTITTPMGAGRIVRHEREGFVLQPYDRDGWITAIRTLAEDHDRRRSMAATAAASAQSFHWNAVALRRQAQIVDRLASRLH